MSFSLYQAGVPAVLHTLDALSKILAKGAAFAEARKIDPSVLINYRLAADMFPLARQVQITCDMAKGMATRLTGSDVPSWADTETSFDELQARIAKTVDFIKSFTPDQYIGGESRDIVLKTGSGTLEMKGDQYLTFFVLPNFYFHATTTYAILRHVGVEIGKWDFLGKT